MCDDIYWIGVFKMQPAHFEDFKVALRPLVEETKREEGALAYEYYVTSDHSRVHILEHYRDSDAVIQHVQNAFSKYAEGFTAVLTVESFVVYGEPNEKAREILDGFGAVYLQHFDGFTK